MVNCKSTELVKITKEWDGKQKPDFKPYMNIINQRLNKKRIYAAGYMPWLYNYSNYSHFAHITKTSMKLIN